MTAANPWLGRLAAAALLLLAAVLGLPWLRQLMGLALPGAAGLAVAALLLALCGLWLEGVRRAGHRRRSVLTLGH